MNAALYVGAIVLALMLAWTGEAWAEVAVWSGGGVVANWSTDANWNGAGSTRVGAPVSGDTLIFPSGAAHLSNNNDISGATFTISFSGGGYTLSGNGVTLGGDLTDSAASGSNTINLPLTLSATRAVTVTNGAETLTLGGSISGGGGLTKAGAGPLVLSNTNSYTGVTTVLAGTILVATAAPASGDGALGNSAGGAILVGDTAAGSTAAALLTGGAFTVGRPVTVRAGNSGTATLGGATADPSTFSGAIILNKDAILQAASGGAVSLSSAISAAAGVTVTGGGTLNLGSGTHVVSGNVAINSGTTLDGASSSLSVGGNWTNNGTFTAGTGTITLDGTTTQTLSGAMSGADAFYNLTLTNTSGADDSGCNISFTPGIIFASAADVTNNYTATVGHVRVQYLAGATYTFANVFWNGQSASTPLFFRSSTPASTWFVKVTGSVVVDYVNVADSTAILTGGGQTIVAVNSIDSCANNVNWQFILDPPIVTSVTPPSAMPGTSGLALTLTGVNFQSPATVEFLVSNGGTWVNDANITGSGSCVNNGITPATEIDCTINIAAGTPIGYRQVIVTNPDSGTSFPATFYVGSLVSTPMVAYGVDGSIDPKYRLLQSNGSWSPESGVGSNSGEPRWSVLRASPLAPEKALGVIDITGKLTLLVWDGTSWGPPLTATIFSGPLGSSSSTRNLDLAYEQLSGEALVVYGLSGSALPHYRVWNGSAWSAESIPTVSLNTASRITWVRLAPQPGSNEIVLVYGDASGAVNALVWDGETNSFGHEQLLTMNAANTQAQAFDGAYTQDSCAGQLPACQAVVAWADAASNTPLYRTWDGANWGPSQSLPIGVSVNAGDWKAVRLAADHYSDRMAAGVVSVSGQVSVSQWSGTAWETGGTGTPQVVAAVPSFNATHAGPFDLAWLGIGGKLFLFSEGVTPLWRTWTAASGWSAPAVLPPSSTLKGQWHLDETVNPLLDSSGNGNNLTLASNGDTAGQSGILDNAVSFFGGSASTAANPASLNITGTTLTMAAWIYPTSFPSSGIILNKESAYEMGINNGLLQAAVRTKVGGGSCGWSWKGNTAVGLNTWQHVAVTFDGTQGEMKFYVNGVLKQTAAASGTMTGCGSTNAFMIGARPSGSYFQGRIDEVEVFDEVRWPLAQTQIAADPISQELLLGRLTQATALSSSRWVHNAWQPQVSLAASASGAQSIPLAGTTLYPASFALTYDQHLQLPPLSVSSVTPGFGYQTETDLTLVMTGTHFACPDNIYPCPMSSNSTQVKFLIGFTPDATVTVTSGTVDDLNQLTVHVAIDPASPPGPRNIQATSPGNQLFITPVSLFEVREPPSVTSTTCPSGGTPPCTLGQKAANEDVFINGVGFDETSVVAFSKSGGNNLTLNSTMLVSPTQLKVNLTLSAAGFPATVGAWDVKVTNGGGRVDSGATGNGTFVVVAGPTVSNVNPNNAVRGAAPFSMTVNGFNFQSGATLSFSGTGVSASGCTYAGVPTSFTCTVTVTGAAEVGFRTATVTNPSPPSGNGGIGSAAGAFNVTGTPVVTGTTPAPAPSCLAFSFSICQLGQGATNYNVTINGDNFNNALGTPTVAFSGGATGSVTVVGAATYVNQTRLRVKVNVSTDASTGPWDVTVTNPSGGGPGTGTGVFRVALPPTITSVDPPSALAGTTGQVVDIYGTNFERAPVTTDLLALDGFSLSDPSKIAADATAIALIQSGGTELTPDANTVALWHLDEGTGAIAGDASGNDNDGTLTSVGAWTKDAGNPVLPLGPGGSWDGVQILNATVINDGGTYKMWYGGNDGANWRGGYATSIDGVTWTKYAGNPVLDLGIAGQPDDNGIIPSTVIFDSGVYKMWYGCNDGTNWRVCYATSADGIAWTKYGGNPVVGIAANGNWDDTHAYHPNVILDDDGTYKMWYSGYDGTNYRIGYATSVDGVGWLKFGGNPVLNLGASGAWDDTHVDNAKVLKVGSLYQMFYGGNDGTNWLGVGMATSADGTTWTKSATNPVIVRGASGWDAVHLIAGPVLLEGATYKIWYSGNDGSAWNGIGYATAPVGPMWTMAAKLSNALSFNGVNDSVSVADTPFDFERTAPFTLEAWIKTSATGGRIFSKLENASPYRGYEFYIDPGGALHAYLISTTLTNAAEVQGSISVNDGQWHHVALTYDGSSSAGGLKLYVDGTPDPGTTTLQDSLSASILNNINLNIGSRNNQTTYFNGSIDEVAVYNIALPATGGGSVQEQYQLTRGHYSAAHETATSPVQPAGGVTTWENLQVTAAGSNCAGGCTAYVKYATSMNGSDPLGNLEPAGTCTTNPLNAAENCYPITAAGTTVIDLSQVPVSGTLTDNQIRVQVELQGDGSDGTSVAVTALNLVSTGSAGPMVGLSGNGITPNPQSSTFIDSGHVQITINIAATATPSTRTLTLTNPDGGVATDSFTVDPPSPNDDAQQKTSTGAVTLNSTTARFGSLSSNYNYIGYRIASVNVPQGATVQHAYLKVHISNTATSTGATYQMHGQYTDNAAPFAASTNNISARIATPYSLNCSPTCITSNSVTSPIYRLNNGYRFFDVTPIVQEIVNRPGWVSGNAMVFVFHAPGSSSMATFSMAESPNQPGFGLIVDGNTTAALPPTHSGAGNFTTPDNGWTSDNAYATAAGMPHSQIYDSYNIPDLTASTISGVLVRVEAKSNSGSVRSEATVALSWDGGTSWTAEKRAFQFDTNDRVFSYGGANAWNHTFLPSELNGTCGGAGSCFKVRVTKDYGSTSSVYVLSVDAVSVKVFTTAQFSQSQSAYRWFANADSTNVGTPLAAQNSPAVAPIQGTPFRLRQLLHVANGTLSTGSQNFKLQVAPQGSDNTCDTGFVGETYTDVATGSGAIRFYDNPTPADGAAVSTNANDPTNGANVAQSYEESNNFTSVQDVPGGSDGLWDFALVDNSAPVGTSYCFRMVYADGTLLPFYAAVPRITTVPAFTQSAYRWFDNTDSTDVGTPLEAQDTATSSPIQGTPFRLRLLLHVAGGTLSAGGQNFKLQAAPQGPDNSCDAGFVGETYADLSAVTGAIRYYNNPTPADGSDVTVNGNDPTHGADTVIPQTYEEANNFTNGNSGTPAIAAGQDGLWDFALVDMGAAPATTYCFRVVKTDGRPLDGYAVVPEITTTGVKFTALIDDNAAQQARFSAPFTVITSGTAATFGSSTSNYNYIGYRRTNVRVPQMAAIRHAYLRVFLSSISTSSIATTVQLNGEAADNSAAFAASSGNLCDDPITPSCTNRPWTAATVDERLNNLSNGYRYFDVTSIVQEIVNRPGWASGNAMAFLFHMPGPSSEAIFAFKSSTHPAQLSILFDDSADAELSPTVSVSGGFTSPDNAFVSDDVYATTTNSTNAHEDYGSFNIAVPPNNIIDGILVKTEAQVSSTSTRAQYLIQLSWDGGTTWTTAKSSFQQDTSDRTESYGGADPWSHTFVPSELTNANFMVRIQNSFANSLEDASVDHVTARVFYHAPGSSAPDAISYSDVAEPSLDNLGGRTGHQIRVIGANFGSVTLGSGNGADCSGGANTGCIQIGGYTIPDDGTITTWTSDAIIFTLPAGITNYGGNLTVTAASQADGSPLNFLVYPHITLLNPTAAAGAKEGDSLTITGTRFGSAQGSQGVVFNDGTNRVAAVTSWSDTSITVTVPGSIADTVDSVTLFVYQGTGGDNTLSDQHANFAMLPEITSVVSLGASLTPQINAARVWSGTDPDGGAGGLVTLQGRHFGNAGTVTVLGQTATQATTPDCTPDPFAYTCIGLRVPATIPATSYTGNVVMTRNTAPSGKTATLPGFRILPRITSLTPASGPSGSPVTIAGDHLCQPAVGPSGACLTASAWNTPDDGDDVLWDFTNGTVVNTPFPAVDPTDTTIYATVPTLADGSFAVTVTSHGYPSNPLTFSTQPATTTLATGTDPADTTVPPGTADFFLDRFTLSTAPTTAQVTSVTVTTTNTAAIASMKIQDNGATQYFTTMTGPDQLGLDTWTFSGGTPITATTTATAYRVIVTFKDDPTLTADLGKDLFVVTGLVTDFVSTSDYPTAGSPDNHVGADTAGNGTTTGTITVDNLPPADAAWGTNTPGDTQIILNWTNPSEPDFSEVVILRNTVAFTTEAPTDAVTYAQGNTGGSLGGSVVRYVGNLQTFTDTGLTNGTGYYYKIFSEDSYGNYADGVDTGPYTPGAKLITCTGGGPLGSIAGDFTISADTTCTGDLTIGGSAVLTMSGDITLTVTGTLLVTGIDTGPASKIVVEAANTFGHIVAADFNIGEGGLVDADGKGCGSSQSFDVTTGSGCVNHGTASGWGEGGDTDEPTGAGGAGFGGVGGKGGDITPSRPGGAGGDMYGLPDLSSGIMLGSGGGNGIRGSTIFGGAGGGAIKLDVSGTLTVNGTISVNGLPGEDNYPNPAGGGSGGSLYITAGVFDGQGQIQANGGDGGVGSNYGTGGGGGGRVVINVTTSNSYLGAYQANGGAADGTGQAGGTGTVTVFGPGGACVFAPNTTATISHSIVCDGDVTIPGNTIVILNGDPLITDPGTESLMFEVTGNLLLDSGAKMIVKSANTFVRIVASNATVNPGASITADGMGYGASLGPGAGDDDSTDTFKGGGGGGYGGVGGKKYDESTGAGPVYGNPQLSPLYPGSGGGNALDPSRGTGQGGAGGGALELCVGSFTTSCAGSGTLTLNGAISANGLDGKRNQLYGFGGGGSGGGLKITAGTAAGNGLLQANGGSGGPQYRNYLIGLGGGGGGGRVYLAAGTISIPLTIDHFQAWGGLAYQNLNRGDAGSLLVVTGGSPPQVIFSGNGTLDDVLDGANDGTQTYSSLTLLNRPVGADSRTFGALVVSTNLHLIGALNAGAGLTVNGTLTADGAVTVTGGTTTVNGPLLAPASTVTVTGVGNPALRINGDVDSTVGQLTVGDVTADTGRVLLAAAGTTVGHAYSHLTAATSVTINSGGTLNGDGLGCGSSLGFNVTTGSGCTTSTTDGPGQGTDRNGYGGAGGGGYGGAGARGNHTGGYSAGGLTYGSSSLSPMMPGSGGGANTDTPGSSPAKPGGSGGGSIRLDVPNLLTVNGTLSVNGGSGATDPTYPETSGGGSGGSLYIDTGALTGTGAVQANGGDGMTKTFISGGGGGGRIVINTGALGSTLQIVALPGDGDMAPPPGAGTVVTTVTGGDTTPPAAVNPLTATAATNGPYTATDQVRLDWTAVGDDGTVGTASSYALGYSTTSISLPITDAIFNGLTQVSGLGAPQAAGNAETFTATGLSSNQTYDFVLKVCDEVPNCSFSSVASVVLPLDTTPPSDVNDLATGTVTANSVVLTFTSPGDDGGPSIDPPCPCGTPKYYVVKYSTSPITSGNFAGATTFDAMVVPKGDGTPNMIEVTGGIAPKTAGQAESITVIGLSQNTLYYFAVEAVDEVGNQSPFGTAVSATTQAVVDVTPPGQISDLQMISVTDRSAMFQWTASGDDGSAGGPATAYDIRYSPLKIIDGTAGNCVTTVGFNEATCPNLIYQVTGEPVPGQPGSVQLMTVNLSSFQWATSNTNYFFAMKAIDDVGLTSTMGTMINTNVSDPIDAGCTNGVGSQNCNLRTTMRLDPVNAVLVSVPLQGPLSPTAIFGPLDGVSNWCGANDLPCLYRWISTGPLNTDGSYYLMDPDPCSANCVETGEGYYFFTNILSLLDYTGTNVTGVTDGHFSGVTPHFHYPLLLGMNLIGNPFKKNVQLQDTHILQTGGGSCTLGEMTFAQAVTAGVVRNAIYVWDGAAEDPVVYNALPPAVLQPWQGYEFFVEDGTCSYELLIPQPN